MIIRTDPERTLFIRQTDHALLSGALAASWAWPFAHRSQVMVAAARHDDGWAEWELSPRLGGDGRPLDFMTTPVDQHVALYRHGIDLVEVEDAYAGLIVSMHGERLYTRPFADDLPPRIESLDGRDLELATEYVEYEHQRQAILADTAIRIEGGPLVTGDLAADAEEAWRLLQVWDRLSLFACMGRVTASWSMDLPPILDADEREVTIAARGTEDGAIELDPYPFEGAEVSFTYRALDIGGDRWPDERSYRQAFRLARPVDMTLAIRPQSS